MDGSSSQLSLSEAGSHLNLALQGPCDIAYPIRGLQNSSRYSCFRSLPCRPAPVLFTPPAQGLLQEQPSPQRAASAGCSIILMGCGVLVVRPGSERGGSCAVLGQPPSVLRSCLLHVALAVHLELRLLHA